MVKKWCQSIWMYVMFIIGAVMAGFLALKWSDWTGPMRLAAINVIILPLHVLEEWILPGGFHYAYNLNKNIAEETLLHRYPMSQLTDMLTNFIAELFFVVLVICHVGKAVAFGIMAFDIMEFVMHTMIGTKMYKRYKEKGKKTIYAPGTLTAYFMQLPVGVAMIFWYTKNGLGLTDVVIGIATMAVGSVCMINLPEGLLKKEDNPYAFRDAGYFKKFGER